MKCLFCENEFIARRKCLENKEKLSIHHIDYNKQNNNPNNLISLCRKCHVKTNFNRNYWKYYFLKHLK
ncbi:MAG: HNH endonuclease [Parcubacteria group bacterium]|nr:HNH endonuclease [Parcubacteria group bacterium]